jgi:von Willebrand factor type A domain/Aerotolerance regulator N-terminal
LTLFFSPLWALGFSNLPILQMGIAAASLPIIIHLLNRRKFREVPWAAMRFLLAAMRKNQRRVKIEQWLLLAVRTLLVILVVMAMAKPFLESLGAMQLLPGQRTHRVILLDGSLSMDYRTAEKSRFQQAKELATRLVRDTRGGDAVSVVLMADPPRVIIGDASPSANQVEVTREIEQLTLPHGGTDLVASFEKLDKVLEVSTIPRKEVVFLTDLQVASWRKPGSEEALKRAVAKLEARKVQSIVIDLGQSGGENRAVVDLRLNQPVVTLGSSDVVLTATVKNFGPKTLNSGRVQLLIDGVIGEAKPIENLQVGEDQPFDFRPKFGTPGDHLVEVKIDDDPLPLDNHRWLAVPVKEVLNVLLVDGHYKSEPFEAETDYLAQALNPTTSSQGTPTTIKVTVIAESNLSGRELAPFDAVVLCNVGQFRESEVAALDAFLKQGGGVVFFGGDQVVPDNYNRLLFADGKGLLPAAIGPTIGDPDKKSGFDFETFNLVHPIVNLFKDREAGVISGLANVKTYRYHKLTLPPGSPAKVALGFGSDPAVVEMPRYRGRVIQVATSADIGWTSWPMHPSYPPVMEQIILQAVGGKLAERNVRVGQPLDQVLASSASGTIADVTRPNDAKATVKVQSAGDVSLFHFEDTDLSGQYRVKYNAPGVNGSTFAADPDPAESDPAKLDRASLAEAVPGWKFDYRNDWNNLTRDAKSIGRHGELHRQLLYAVLALLIIESILAWRFGHHAA